MRGALISLKSGATLKSGAAVAPVIASASVRARISTRVATTAASNGITHRTRHKTNIAGTALHFEFYNGYVNNGGVSAYPNASPETATAAATQRWCLVKNPTSTGLNAGGTPYPITWFGMLADAAFVAAGGTVSGDGFTIFVPSNYVIKSDPLAGVSFTAGEAFLFQVEDIRAVGAARPIMCLGRPDLGDALGASSTQPTLVNSTNWTGGQGVSQSTSSLMGPNLVHITAAAGTKTVVVHGDSIISENADYGDADGALAFAKRALNAGGYSFYDLSVPGTNIGYILNFNAMGIRKRWLPLGDTILTNHGNNDVSNIGWDTNSNSLKTLLTNHTAFLRANGKPGVRIVQCTLSIREGSTDLWNSIANQSSANNDDRWGLETYARYGAQINLMRLGPYEGTPLPSSLADAVYDFHTALGAVDDVPGQTSKWPMTIMGQAQFSGTLASAITAGSGAPFNVTCTTPPPLWSNLSLNFAGGAAGENVAGYVMSRTDNGNGTWAITLTAAPSKAQSVGVTVTTVPSRDGTHPVMNLQMQAANDFGTKLPATIGW
jgi:hypothetical protein